MTEIIDLRRHLDFDLFAPKFSTDITPNGYSNPETTNQPSLNKAPRAFRNTPAICLTRNITEVSISKSNLTFFWLPLPIGAHTAPPFIPPKNEYQ